MSRKIISLVLSFGLLFQQIGFAQIATELNIASHLSRMASSLVVEKFRPAHLRYFSYDNLNDSFKVLLDKGDLKDLKAPELESSTKTLLSYFLVGITLPDSMFWVNLRPDSENQIIDPYLEKTDVGRIMLEADLQLKKDTALFTSPQTPEGKEYWNKLYKKAGELYGYDNVTIPTLTRPWIVPGEIIVRESKDSAYVYKAGLKVMLEQDYLKGSATYSFQDERSKALNEYSSQLIRELIIPKLTREVNSSKRYASLRQVYFSLILSRWFKLRFSGKTGAYSSLINSQNLSNLISKEPWSKTDYFKQYQKSFSEGEYNVKEPVYTPTGQVIRSYFSGGISMLADSPINNPNSFAGSPISSKILESERVVLWKGYLKSGLSSVLDLLTSPQKNTVIPREQFLEVYNRNLEDIEITAKELRMTKGMAQHHLRQYASLSQPKSADLSAEADHSQGGAASPVLAIKEIKMNWLEGAKIEDEFKEAIEKGLRDKLKTLLSQLGATDKKSLLDIKYLWLPGFNQQTVSASFKINTVQKQAEVIIYLDSNVIVALPKISLTDPSPIKEAQSVKSAAQGAKDLTPGTENTTSVYRSNASSAIAGKIGNDPQALLGLHTKILNIQGSFKVVFGYGFGRNRINFKNTEVIDRIGKELQESGLSFSEAVYVLHGNNPAELLRLMDYRLSDGVYQFNMNSIVLSRHFEDAVVKVILNSALLEDKEDAQIQLIAWYIIKNMQGGYEKFTYGNHQTSQEEAYRYAKGYFDNVDLDRRIGNIKNAELRAMVWRIVLTYNQESRDKLVAACKDAISLSWDYRYTPGTYWFEAKESIQGIVKRATGIAGSPVIIRNLSELEGLKTNLAQINNAADLADADLKSQFNKLRSEAMQRASDVLIRVSASDFEDDGIARSLRVALETLNSQEEEKQKEIDGTFRDKREKIRQIATDSLKEIEGADIRKALEQFLEETTKSASSAVQAISEFAEMVEQLAVYADVYFDIAKGTLTISYPGNLPLGDKEEIGRLSGEVKELVIAVSSIIGKKTARPLIQFPRGILADKIEGYLLREAKISASSSLQADVKFTRWYGLKDVEVEIPQGLKEAIFNESVPVIQRSIRKSIYFEGTRTIAFNFPALVKIGDFYLSFDVPKNSEFAEGVRGVLKHRGGSYLADVEIKFKSQTTSSPVQEEQASKELIRERIRELQDNIVDNQERIEEINSSIFANSKEIRGIARKLQRDRSADSSGLSRIAEKLKKQNQRNNSEIAGIYSSIYDMRTELVDLEKELATSSPVQADSILLDKALKVLQDPQLLSNPKVNQVIEKLQTRRIVYPSDWKIAMQYTPDAVITRVKLIDPEQRIVMIIFQNANLLKTGEPYVVSLLLDKIQGKLTKGSTSGSEKRASSAVTYVDINEVKPPDNSFTFRPTEERRIFINGRVQSYTLQLARYEPGKKTYLIFKIGNQPVHYAYLGNNLTIGQQDVVRTIMSRIENGTQLWTEIDLIQELKKELSMSQYKPLTPLAQELPLLIAIEPIVDNKIKVESGRSGGASSAVQNKYIEELMGRNDLAELRNLLEDATVTSGTLTPVPEASGVLGPGAISLDNGDTYYNGKVGFNPLFDQIAEVALKLNRPAILDLVIERLKQIRAGLEEQEMRRRKNTIPNDYSSESGLIKKIDEAISDRIGQLESNKTSASSAVEAEAPRRMGAIDGSIPLTIDSKKDVGGIDFRALPMTIQPMGSFQGLNFKLPQLSQQELGRIDIPLEVERVKNMVASGTSPSGSRIKELIVACKYKQQEAYINDLFICLLDGFKVEQENALESSPDSREALVVADVLVSGQA